jgi:hypothetical protein
MAFLVCSLLVSPALGWIPLHQIRGGGMLKAYSSDSPISPNSSEAQRFILEDFTRFSQSHLWKLVLSLYERAGIENWSDGIVPSFITSNAFIGRSYAKILQGFIRDCPTLNHDEKLYIVELGAGSGKFSFYMMKALLETCEDLNFPVKNIVYVVTDFTDANTKVWRDHPQLKQYFDRGLMDSAIFDASNDKSITLSNSNVCLSPGSVKNPICVVANYLFDSLETDIFQVRKCFN